MNEIEGVEALENENQSIELTIMRLQDDIVSNKNTIEELKKADEVKPMFGEDCDYIVCIQSTNDAVKLGLCSKTQAGRNNILLWLEARKYITETINQANKGDNGFKPGEYNFYVYRNITVLTNKTTVNIMYDWDSVSTAQRLEDKLYLRSSKEAARLVDDKEFIWNLDIYLN